MRAAVRFALALLAAAVVAGGCQRDTPGPGIVRLTDPGNGERRSMIIGGDERPILDPFKAEAVWPLRDLPPDPVFAAALGLPGNLPGTVRFDVVLETADGQRRNIFRQSVSPPEAWTEVRIPLAGLPLEGGTLRLRRSRVEGDLRRLFRSAWGNPRIESGTPATRPSVVLVSLDTLRADRVGAYGYAAARTPVLDRLAADGVAFSAAYAPSLSTLPSHAGLFYGRHVASPPPMLRKQKQPAPAGVPERPLPAALADAGYLTAGFTGGGFVSSNFSFGVGFDTYYSYRAPRGPRAACQPARFDAPEVFRRATEWLREAPADQPFFLFVHTAEPRDRCEFLSADEPGRTDWPKLPPDRQQALLAHYDELIARTDGYLGELLRALDAIGRRDDTLVVVTSDHGEGFDEHGIRGHGCDAKPYEELGRVPLVLRWPDRLPAGERVAAPVSLIDVAPTILALVGLTGQSGLDGPVLPGLGLPTGGDPAPVLVVCDDTIGVRAGRDKLIASRAGAFPDELYDLAGDPAERANLAAGAPPRVAALRRHAEAFWQGAGASATTGDR